MSHTNNQDMLSGANASSPTISVVMSVYNGEKHLADAIESVLNQTFPDFEFIIVDDGSTDKTAGIARVFAKKDPRIRLIQLKENTGCPAAVNIGLEHAQGEIIARMDSDDICLSHRFETQLRIMREHDVDLCGSCIIIIDQAGVEKTRQVYNPDVDAIIRQRIPFCQPTIMIRKDAFDRYGWYDPEFVVAQDYELALRFWAKGATFHICPDFLLKYRIHDFNISRTRKFRDAQRNSILARLMAVRLYGVKLGVHGWWRLFADALVLLIPSFLVVRFFNIAQFFRIKLKLDVV
jgi:glycosyltransferase involved in cell wall biosynthesis